MRNFRALMINAMWAAGWLVRPVVVILARLVPSRPGLMVMGARNGFYYMDNSRYLFEWLREHRPNWRLVWLTWRRSVVRELREQGHESEWMPTPRAMVVLLKAELAVYCNRLLDVSMHPAFIPARTRMLALSHGVGVKAKRNTRKDRLSWPLRNELRITDRRNSLAIASSDFMARLCARSQGISLSSHRITGYPRNDLLFDAHPESEAKWNSVSGARSYSRVILYAPTWRQGSAARFFPFADFSVERLQEWLFQTDTLLLVRPHIKDMRGDQFLDETAESLVRAGSSNIRPLRVDLCADCYQIMRRIDILVTDYSSIYHDFLLLNRPILMVPYDYHDYGKANGFQYDYHDNLPGPVIDSLSVFISVINKLSCGMDSHVEQRIRLRDRLHDFRDGRSCSRLAKLIEAEILDTYRGQ